jgi:hypothetical protein
MMKQASRLECITPKTGMTLTAHDSNGRVLQIDLFGLFGLSNRLQTFAPIVDSHEFSTAKVTDFGWTVDWDCGAPLDSDRLIDIALEQAGTMVTVDYPPTITTPTTP